MLKDTIYLSNSRLILKKTKNFILIQEFIDGKDISQEIPTEKTLNKIVIGAMALLLTLGSYWWWKSTTNTNQQPFLALTYENKSYGIEMQYPDNWQLEAIADPFGTIAKFIPTNSQYSSSFSQTRASLGQHSQASPLGGFPDLKELAFAPDGVLKDTAAHNAGSDRFPSSGNPLALAKLYPKGQLYPKGLGVARQVSIIVDDISSNTSLDDYTNSAVSRILEFSPDAEIIDNSLIDLGDISGHKVIYTTKYTESNLPLKYLQFWTLKGSHAYIITYVAEEDKYQNSLEIVQQTMLKSFTINN